MKDMSDDRILYIDPFSGISGDMFLGGLLSLGLPSGVMEAAVEAVIPGEIRYDISDVLRGGLAGKRCEVIIESGPARRSLEEMITLVREAHLPDEVRSRSAGVLESLGKAEGSAHGSGKAIHLHELGGQDTIADVVGVMAGVHHLGVKRILSGPVNVGSGFVDTEHGTMPVPAPATACLLEGVPVFSRGPSVELTTPTGAALLRELVSEYGSLPPMSLETIATGAGGRDNPGLPNLLRIFSGRPMGTSHGSGSVMIECGLDDVSPEYLAPLTGELHDAGAMEVHVISAYTKKGRVGVLLRVLVPSEDKERMLDAVLERSGSAGLRYWDVARKILHREVIRVDTPHGEVRIKRWLLPSGRWRAKPEFEDINAISIRTGIPPEEMRERAMALYYLEHGNGQKKD
ncbi:MAG TPA: nickel pincer cofactor biosynthesis protein LarC [Proteobacteria bacterium]|nr:hypothetical protein BMS3Abin14_00263 [bacterium BMS3Abin14]HDL53004.1 nickel pincer cofactor biosynthesis protein LarC [Pseudomonadota bacterium]